MTFQKKKKKDCRLLDKVRLRNMKAKSREVIITKEKEKKEVNTCYCFGV